MSRDALVVLLSSRRLPAPLPPSTLRCLVPLCCHLASALSRAACTATLQQQPGLLCAIGEATALQLRDVSDGSPGASPAAARPLVRRRSIDRRMQQRIGRLDWIGRSDATGGERTGGEPRAIIPPSHAAAWTPRSRRFLSSVALACSCASAAVSVVLPPPLHSPTMVLMSVLNSCLVTLTNAERRGKRQVLIRPVSKVVVKFLQVRARIERKRMQRWMSSERGVGCSLDCAMLTPILCVCCVGR